MGVGAKIFSLAGPVLAVGFSFRRHRRSLHAHRQNSLGGGYYGRDKGNGGKKSGRRKEGKLLMTRREEPRRQKKNRNAGE